MAWRIDEPLIKGELDNRIRGTTTGTLWFQGRDEPVILNLQGNPWRDLAGHVLRFVNPNPKPGTDLSGVATHQEGVVGDITASRKVRVPDCPREEFIAGYKSGRVFTFHMANSLYLEWYSEANGRVVIESADYQIDLSSQATWTMTEDEEQQQIKANSEAIVHFMQRLADAMDQDHHLPDPEHDDHPTSEIEAQAEAETARMNRLTDRIHARLEKEGFDDPNAYERIWREEREKLRIEMGEPEPEPLTPEQEAERAAWIEEMNRVCEEALANPDEMEDPFENHPLVTLCSDLGIRIFHDIKNNAWVDEQAHHEHPLLEIEGGVQAASAKLAGALNGTSRREEWPPHPLFAGDTLVRLKKARSYLRDALAGLDAADQQRLATSPWRSEIRQHIEHIIAAVQTAIDEVRESLN
ncbi:MAG TPA: hypothetical protein PKE55_05325 [Kiritimatiellia bacterium]|nr:hypothetical protein [Kiritimatiellia bacterium]